MSAFPAVSHHSRRTLIAFLLCFLAFSFAIEAKTAWYGPFGGPGTDVRAAKAMPADSPELVFHGVPAPDPLHPQYHIVFLLELAVALTVGAALFLRQASAGFPAPRPAATFFYPGIFFRPPPVR